MNLFENNNDRKEVRGYRKKLNKYYGLNGFDLFLIGQEKPLRVSIFRLKRSNPRNFFNVAEFVFMLLFPVDIP